MVSLAGASVALVILIDLATGQGPPALNNYFGPPGQYLQPPVMQPVNFMPPRGEYDFKRPAPVEKFVAEKEPNAYGDKEKVEEKYSKEGPAYDNEKGVSETTPAPGVLASFQNSMSDAWKSLTNLGRHSRSVRDVSGQEDDEFENLKSAHHHKAEGHKDKGHSMDEYETRHQNNHGYIFFKIPKNLVCNKQ